MRPNSDRADTEPLALAEATDRVADAVADPAIEARLRAIVGEVRAVARGGDVLAATLRPA